MILEFGAKNFYSFKEGFEVNLRTKNSDIDKVAYNVFTVKGANASGKTNVLKLLEFINKFAINSFTYYKPDQEIDIFSYFNNNNPIEIFIIFYYDDIEYKYELALTRQEVISEIFYKKDKRYTTIIKREKDNITHTTAEYKELKTIKLRKNVSLLSAAIQHEIKSIKSLQFIFNSIYTNVNHFGRSERDQNDHANASEIYNDIKSNFNFANYILKNIDTGIDHIKIHSRKDNETGKVTYFPIFYFKIDEELKPLTYYEQSSGTKALYLQLWLYNAVLDLGYTLVLDEFDINLHPDILPVLVDLFDDPVKNTKNAQLIFTTHNTDIIDKLGKYRVAFVNKEDNESYLYNLDEIPGDILRNDRPITPAYKAGKIGGKPKVTM